MPVRQCIKCGKSFSVRMAAIRQNRGKYCSRACIPNHVADISEKRMRNIRGTMREFRKNEFGKWVRTPIEKTLKQKVTKHIIPKPKTIKVPRIKPVKKVVKVFATRVIDESNQVFVKIAKGTWKLKKTA